MCIMSYIPAGVDVPWEALFNGACSNPDGHGWAVAKGDQILTGKSMDMFKAAEGLEQALKDLPGGVSLFHSRIATAGTVDEFNVHPFYVGGTTDTVMAHNGILPSRWQPERADARSDTQLFADEMGWLIDNPRGVPSRRIGKVLGQVIGTYNKLVFMSVKAGHPMVRIINAQQGVMHDGVWHSNRSFEKYSPSFRRGSDHRLAFDRDREAHWSEWKPKPYERPVPLHGPQSPYGTHREYVPGQGTGTGTGGSTYAPGNWRRPYDWDAEEFEVEPCILCKGLNIDDVNYCEDCGGCQDCGLNELQCDCYVPESRVSGTNDEVQDWLARKEGVEDKDIDEQDREWMAWREERMREEQEREDAEWAEYLAEARARQAARAQERTDRVKLPTETWDEFIARQAALRQARMDAARAAAASPLAVEFKAPLAIEAGPSCSTERSSSVVSSQG